MDSVDTKPRFRWIKVLFVFAALITVIALGALAYIFYTYQAGQDEYEKLTEYIEVSDKDDVLTLGSFNVDWDALRAINSDVVGWVYIPNTIINYPIVWRKNNDYYYTKHSFGNNSVGGFGAEYGAIALSGANSPDWTDQANFISGHHMSNGMMFASIADFQNSETFNANRTVFVLTPVGNFKMTSFACDKIRGSSRDTVIPNFETKEDFKNYLQECIDDSKANPDPIYSTADTIEQIFSFYTCSEPDNQYRIMLYCSVDEFLPAGSDVMKGNALVDASDVANAQGAIGERLL